MPTEKRLPLVAIKKKDAPPSPAPPEEVLVDETLSPSVPQEKVSEPVPEDREDHPYFQAIGTLYTTVERQEDGSFFIRMSGQKYRLYIPRNRFRAWLQQFTHNPDTSLYLRVYPKCKIVPRQPSEIQFELVAWGEDNRWAEESGVFIMKGIWQFTPQFRTPVISIYRNSDATDPWGKFKASHLPVLMKREDETVRPFRFNPKVPKEQLPKRWFIEARFKFLSSRNCWGWVEDISPPSDRIPRYKKPVKAVAQASTVDKPQMRMPPSEG